MQEQSHSMLKYTLYVSALILIVAVAGGIYIASNPAATQETEQSAAAKGELYYSNYLVDQTRSQLEQLKSLITNPADQVQSFNLIPVVSAQSTGLNERQQEILEIVSDIEQNIAELQIVVEETNSQELADFLTALRSELDDLKNEFNLLVQETNIENAILIRSIGESLRELDRTITRNAVEKLADDTFTSTQIERLYNEMVLELELVEEMFSQLDPALTLEDSAIVSGYLAEANQSLPLARTEIDAGNYNAAYEILDAAELPLDQAEEILEIYMIEEEEQDLEENESTEIRQLDALEKIQNAQNRIAKAIEEVDEESPSAEVLIEIESLLNEAQALVDEAQASFDSGDFETAKRLANAAREKANLAIRLANKNSTEESGEQLAEAQEAIAEAQEALNNAITDGQTGLINAATNLLGEAQEQLTRGNYVAALRLATNSEKLSEASLEDREDSDGEDDNDDEQRDEVGNLDRPSDRPGNSSQSNQDREDEDVDNEEREETRSRDENDEREESRNSNEEPDEENQDEATNRDPFLSRNDPPVEPIPFQDNVLGARSGSLSYYLRRLSTL